MVLRAFCAIVLLGLCGATAAAQTYAPSPLTAVQVLQKARAADGLLEAGTFKVVARWNVGGLDTTSTEYTDGTNDLETDVTGPFTTSFGTFGGQQWSRNENGIVTLESGYYRRENPDLRALRHPEEPANRVTLLGKTTSGRAEYVVDVDPPDGEHQQRYYDATTFTLDRVVTWRKDRLKHVVTFEDYRTLFGRRRAYRWHSGDGRSQNDLNGRVVSVERVTAAPPMTIPISRPIFAFPSNAPVELPARFDGGAIIVRLTIRGRGLDFLLDSGASSIVIDPGVAHELGLPMYGKTSDTIGGSFDESQTIVPDVSVGTLHMKNVVFSVSPIDDVHRNARVVGLLGYDFLASAAFALDFKKQTVTAFPPGVLMTQDRVTLIPMQIDGGTPRVAAWFENVAGKFLLDTGADATMLSRSYADKLPRRTNIYGQWSASFVGGDVSVNRYMVHDLNFGGFLYRNAAVFVPTESTADISSHDGVIGRDVLRDFTLFFDYPEHAIAVEYRGS